MVEAEVMAKERSELTKTLRSSSVAEKHMSKREHDVLK